MAKGGGQQYGLPSVQMSNTNTSTTIPKWLEGASQAGVANAGKLLNQPVQAYQGQLAPGMTNDQQMAGDIVRNSIGAYQPYFDTAAGMTQASTAATPMISPETFRNGLSGAINDYMNPYIGNVVNSVQALSDQNLNRALTQTADQAIGAKAFGGSRHGVQEGVATAQNNLNTNNLLANLLNSGYNQATSLMGQDISNNLQAQGANQNAFSSWMNRMQGAGSQMSQLGTANRAANVADVNNLLSYGGLEQSTQGNQMQAAYNEWLRQQNMPLQMQQLYNQSVSAAPHSTTGTSSTTSYGMQPQQQQTSSPLMGALGLGMAGLSMLPGGTIPGLLGGMGLGIPGTMSNVVGGLGGRAVPTFW